MTPTETALMLLLSLASGTGGWAIGHGAKPSAVRPAQVATPRPAASICPPCPAVVLQPRAPACGQHARFDPVEMEYHRHRLAAGVFSRIEAEGEKR